MILYTMQPYQWMFPEEGNDVQPENLILYQDIPVLVEQVGQEMRIVRVMSTDPYHYLREDCQPGQMLRTF